MPFIFEPAQIPGVCLITPRVFSDHRGHFLETFKASVFADAGVRGEFVQDNESESVAGALRGLHYQLPPHAQGKLVRVIHGSIYDVVVDIRRSSTTFGTWQGFDLNASAGQLLWVPAGFAHGFLAFQDGTRVAYKATSEYSPAAERCIRFDDPTLSIHWPAVTELRVSKKDRDGALLSDAEVFN